MIVCMCKTITEDDVFQAIEAGNHTVDALAEQLGMGTDCEACIDYTQQLLDEALHNQQQMHILSPA